MTTRHTETTSVRLAEIDAETLGVDLDPAVEPVWQHCLAQQHRVHALLEARQDLWHLQPEHTVNTRTSNAMCFAINQEA